MRQTESSAEVSLAPPRDRDRRVREARGAEHLVEDKFKSPALALPAARGRRSALLMDESIPCRLARARDRTQVERKNQGENPAGGTMTYVVLVLAP